MRLIFMYFRLLSRLNRVAKIAILSSTLIFPIILKILDLWPATGPCPACEAGAWLAVHIVMTLTLLGIIARSSSVDENKVNNRLHRMSSELNDGISNLRRDQEREIARTQTHVRDLQNWLEHIDRALREQLDIELPSPGLSAEGVLWKFETRTPDVTLTQKPIRRFRIWFRYWILGKDD